MFPRRYDNRPELVLQRDAQDPFWEPTIRKRMEVVRLRPQFQIRNQVILREKGPNGPRIIRVFYRDGTVEEGLDIVLLSLREDKIRAAAIASLREDV